MLKLRGRKVVLFLPPYAGKVLGPPLGLLSLAGIAARSRLRTVHHRRRARSRLPATDRARDRRLPLLRRFAAHRPDDPRCDRSQPAGSQLRPDVPIIYGGWHPSLLTAETLREDFVDIVVRHQGEKTLVEILQRLGAGKPLDMVQGCWFKRDGRIHQNPDRPASPLSACPLPAYDLIDFDAYERAGGETQAALRHQHRLPVRVQLLHRHGVLQPALQSLRRGARGRAK